MFANGLLHTRFYEIYIIGLIFILFFVYYFQVVRSPNKTEVILCLPSSKVYNPYFGSFLSDD